MLFSKCWHLKDYPGFNILMYLLEITDCLGPVSGLYAWTIILTLGHFFGRKTHFS